MGDYILSIDQGTSSSRAILFNQQGQVCDLAQQAFEQIYPQPGWVEHDPQAIWQTCLQSCQQVLADDSIKVCAIGICNQRETTLIWDRKTGQPIYNAIVWQDRRTSDYCKSLKQQGLEPQITQKTGLLCDPYFSATKIKWILDNVPGARQKAEQGELAFGTVDTFLIYKLTGGLCHYTDASNASRTLLYNLHTGNWDDDLLKLFNIPSSMLPEIKDSSAHFGDTQSHLFNRKIAINGVAGDQQAALFGQACFSPGMAKSTYGTGCFLMVNTGKQPCFSNNRLLTTIAYQLNGQRYYASEGSIFIAGAAVQWLRDKLNIIETAKQTEQLVKNQAYEQDVYLVPSFTGLGAPHWQPDAQGALLGLSQTTGRAEIVAACLQSVAYQTKDLQQAMLADNITINSLRIDGGMADNNWAMQFLADILSVELERSNTVEISALGAAFLAGLYQGFYPSVEHISQLYQTASRFKPQLDLKQQTQLYQKWQRAVELVKAF